MTGTSIVWLRDDLRLADNPALDAAVGHGGDVIVVYVLDEVSPEVRTLGAASTWWLHHSLAAINERLGGSLVLRRGAGDEVLATLADEVDAEAVFWNRRYSSSREVDARLKARLREGGREATSFAANLLVEPWTITTSDGSPYRVFTPFWRASLERDVRMPLPEPDLSAIRGPADVGLGILSEDLDEWRLLPTRPDWAGGLRETWTPGELGAQARLADFLENGLDQYDRRDEPAVPATSRLSPHLRFGEISPYQLWHSVKGRSPKSAGYLREVGWREFNWNLLYHWPDLATKNFRPAFDAFGWSEPDDETLDAWHHGRTGIPLVDAGMRELWHTGYMHNRVRMVAASLLIKNLLVDWRIGEEWFWDTLVDADEANNPGSWQWVAGSGADAAPYFRVFNPELQAAKFDPDADYIRRWVPEYGTPDYPDPIVDLKESRKDALAAYEAVKAAN
ncbi:deoxyribodipyrimidine photo-lyase [Microbacteriaceae bacterium SG_E_30_P1]|uniref:Deoxyribodipyrimidine photo-lyase n=1 Tax=Antiquaquibacter oligotrophicus TaxID=2880260 RepID=A0ABT6KQ29_9MICO|nr:deoxyribodipyrimidine photo-lyase [Antiquaquibacter oligotrophicus]MDH6182068.1 deoxyribodipyrimidine photo-lyase [Antiquaquibacter oligotrophicus]UDF12265.1 DNA photolyase family protein [Antiquaquibacter oligotrophicus]